MTKLALENISFSFGTHKNGKPNGKSEATIKNFSLDVDEGSFTTLLGPSGCGKTTLLRLISGFLKPDSGRVLIDGKDQAKLEVNERKIGLVFQDYALFPHMTVRQNILYGLKIQKNHLKRHHKLADFRCHPDSVAASENDIRRNKFDDGTNGGFNKLDNNNLDEIVRGIARDLAIENLLERYPNELSGGQQQRVSLGRALVLKPKILLMDEPLSSLDTKLREKVRDELKEIQQKVGITTVYVTHDQEEALSLSTKIAVINKGELLQEGTPREIYFEPKDKFTADFVGKANFFEENGKTILIRPEWFELRHSERSGESNNRSDKLFHGKIVSSSFLGEKTRFLIELDGSEKIVTADFDTLETENLKLGNEVLMKVRNSFEMR